MKALIIDANAHSSSSLSRTLARHQFNIASATSHDDAMQILECFEVDIVIMNEKNEGLCSLSMLRKARLEGVATPVIMIAAAESRVNAVDAFAAGADDFIRRKVDEEELVARIRAVVRRTCGVASTTIQFENLTIDLNNSCAFADDKPIKLTVKEYELLQALAMRRGRTVSKENLMSLLYNHECEPELKIIDVFVCKLRKKLSAALGGENPIETVWGRGYMMRGAKTAEVEKSPQHVGLNMGSSRFPSVATATKNTLGLRKSDFAHVA